MSEWNSDSESASYLTGSESESEPGSGAEQVHQPKKEVNSLKHLEFAENILKSCGNVSIENALKLNEANQSMLVQMRNNLQELLNRCRERQSEVDILVATYRDRKKPRKKHSKTYGYICGQPYFKDEELYPGPHNDDYLIRKRALKEYFPLDAFEMAEPHWQEKDKTELLKAVQEQIVEYLRKEIASKIRNSDNCALYEALRKDLANKKLTKLYALCQNQKYQWENPLNIDWMKISNISLSERHTANACIGMWNNFLRPDIVKNSIWSKNEEDSLLKAAQEENAQDWDLIASKVSGRSPYQCFVYYQTNFSKISQIKHVKWTTEEDNILWQAIEDNRTGDNILWNRVVEKVPYRNKVQCYNRYMFTLRPDQNKRENFSKQEDCTILAFVAQYGEKFNLWPQDLLPGRNARQIWCRYNHTLKNVSKHSPWTYEDDLKLMEFIKDHKHIIETNGNMPWTVAANKYLDNKHTRMSCRTRYLTIEKYFAAHPDLTLESVPRKPKRLSTIVTKDNWHQQLTTLDEIDHQIKPKPKKRHEKWEKSFFNQIVDCEAKPKLKEAFKYAYKLNFGENNVMQRSNLSLVETKEALQQLNGPENYQEALINSKSKFSRKEFLLQKRILDLPNQSVNMEIEKLPLNWNTISGIRGIILHANISKNDKFEDTNVVEKEKYLEHLAKFRDRFKKIFYWPIVLSKLQTIRPETMTVLEDNFESTGIFEIPNVSNIDWNLEDNSNTGGVDYKDSNHDDSSIDTASVIEIGEYPAEDPSKMIVTESGKVTYFGVEPANKNLIQEILERANKIGQYVNQGPSAKNILFKVENVSPDNTMKIECAGPSNSVVYNVQYVDEISSQSTEVVPSSESIEETYEDIGIEESTVQDASTTIENSRIVENHNDHILVEEVTSTDVHVVYKNTSAKKTTNFKPYKPNTEKPVDTEAEKLQQLEKEKQAINQLVKLMNKGKNAEPRERTIPNTSKTTPRRSQRRTNIVNKDVVVPEPEIVLDAASEIVFEIQEVTPQQSKNSMQKPIENQNVASPQVSEESFQGLLTPTRCSEPEDGSDSELVEVYQIVEDDNDDENEDAEATEQGESNQRLEFSKVQNNDCQVQSTSKDCEKIDDLEENNPEDMNVECGEFSQTVSNQYSQISQTDEDSEDFYEDMDIENKDFEGCVSPTPDQNNWQLQTGNTEGGAFPGRISPPILDQNYSQFVSQKSNSETDAISCGVLTHTSDQHGMTDDLYKPLSTINLDHKERSNIAISLETDLSKKPESVVNLIPDNCILIRPLSKFKKAVLNNKRKSSTTIEDHNIPAKIMRSVPPYEQALQEEMIDPHDKSKKRLEISNNHNETTTTDGLAGLQEKTKQKPNYIHNELNAVDFLDALNRMYDYDYDSADDVDEDEDFLVNGTSEKMAEKIDVQKAGTSKEAEQSDPRKIVETRNPKMGILRKIIDSATEELKIGGITIKRLEKM